MLRFPTKYGNFNVFKNDEAFVNSLSRGKSFESNIIEDKLKQYILKSNIILDIGAHIGSHSIVYSKMNPKSVIYSFEPQRQIFNLLQINVMQNDCNNIIIYNNAVGNEIRELTMSNIVLDGYNKIVEYGSHTPLNLGGIQVGKNGETVQCITIDSLDLSGCDFMKIDVEGFEPYVLLGAKETIIKYCPTIFLEYNHKKIDEETCKHFNIEFSLSPIEIVKTFGYKNIEYVSDGNYLCTF